MNDDELDLPRRRELPVALRGRIRAAVNEGVGSSSRSGKRTLRTPMVVAAIVTALFAGAVLATQGLTGDGNGGFASPDPAPEAAPVPGLLDPAAQNEVLDRCWTAVLKEGAEDGYPDRAQWTGVSGFRRDGLSIVAARAAGKPVFCETTRTTVTVTDPDAEPVYAGGSRTGSLLFSDNGVIAGVADPSWPAMRMSGRLGTYSFGSDVQVKDGLFVEDTNHRVSGTRIEVSPMTAEHQTGEGMGPEGVVPVGAVLPPPSAQPLRVVDRHMWPGLDRESETGRFFGECAERSQSPVIDTDTYVAGARASHDGRELVMARNHYGYIACSKTFDEADADLARPAEPDDVRGNAVHYAGVQSTTGTLYGGVVPDSAVRVVLTRGEAAPVEAAVAAGTFAAALEGPALPPPSPPDSSGGNDAVAIEPLPVRATAYDAAGAVIFDDVLR